MSASNKKSKKTSQTETNEQLVKEFDNDVLFQKIFDKWYAFSVIDGECMMTEVPEERINQYKQNMK